MLTDNIKNFTDEEVINLINKIVMEEVSPELADLKAILAEASGRKLEKNYINIIAEKIKEKVGTSKPEPKRQVSEIKVPDAVKKPTFEDIYDYEDDEEEEEYDDKYPVLSFISGLYKVFAWILFAAAIAAGAIISVFLVAGNIIAVCAVMFGSIVVSIILLLAFLAMAENIKLKLDIEKHLSKL